MYPSSVDSPLWASPFACYRQDDGLFPYVDMIAPPVASKPDYFDSFSVFPDTNASVASPDLEMLPILDPDEAFILASLLLDPPEHEEASFESGKTKEPPFPSSPAPTTTAPSTKSLVPSLLPMTPSLQMRVQPPPLAPAPIVLMSDHEVAPTAAKRQRTAVADYQQRGASRGRCCMAPGCLKTSQSRGLCIRHGGGKRCSVEGCSRGAQATGRCKSHGGGVRCKVPGCGKGSQGSGLCRSHGGGKICEFPGCKKGTQRAGKCSTHGGARICVVAGCTKVDRGGGLCGRHKQLKP